MSIQSTYQMIRIVAKSLLAQIAEKCEFELD